MNSKSVKEIGSHMSLLTFPNSGNTYYYRSKIQANLIEQSIMNNLKKK